MLTIGKLAKHCQVNVETIRYYQRIQELNALKQRLSSWVDECKTTTDSCCPILQELKKGSTTTL